MTPPDFRAGDELSASKLLAIVAELVRLGKIEGVAPVNVSSDAAGVRIELGLVPSFRHGIVGGTAIDAASSTTQMTSGAGTLAKADADGAVADTGVPAQFWNKATNGDVPANAIVGYAIDDAGLKVITWVMC